ncbi:hypothetical protein [Lapidilactobacillus gannanensis]|uniref:Uncharacterized protein n=1 Tax=Lapidilactobacillus gannanensis TaxID=2486002 RepID=A0ABW4BMH3_9LACO|nr:hypothetical protein [Lapidilactobacillus gannanensis]
MTKTTRGYLPETASLPLASNQAELLKMISAADAVTRTAAARIIRQKQSLDVPLTLALLAQLQLEDKLYPKIEICQTLQTGDAAVIKLMLPLVGKIGHNQLISWRQCTTSKKISYPLPRDIIARTLARVSADYFSDILVFFENNATEAEQMELLDTLGFKCFYSPTLASAENLRRIYLSLKKPLGDNLLTWKFVTLLSAFDNALSQQIMATLSEQTRPLIQTELQRSARLAANKHDDIG